jgi:hypothetical protein
MQIVREPNFVFLSKLVARQPFCRNTPPRSGTIRGFDRLAAVPVVNSGIISTLKRECCAGLHRRAVRTTLYALAEMLVYIAFRFAWILGVGAVLGVFHDIAVTTGRFPIFGGGISLTVMAALLALMSHSMNGHHHRHVLAGIHGQPDRCSDPTGQRLEASGSRGGAASGLGAAGPAKKGPMRVVK